MVFGKQKIATLVAEFLGTGALTLLILSVQRSTIGVPFFVAAAAGLSIALMIMAVGKTSGGYFNPALTIGFWTARKIETVTAVLYILVQFAGAFAAGALYAYFVKNKLQHPDCRGYRYCNLRLWRCFSRLPKASPSRPSIVCWSSIDDRFYCRFICRYWPAKPCSSFGNQSLGPRYIRTWPNHWCRSWCPALRFAIR